MLGASLRWAAGLYGVAAWRGCGAVLCDSEGTRVFLCLFLGQKKKGRPCPCGMREPTTLNVTPFPACQASNPRLLPMSKQAAWSAGGASFQSRKGGVQTANCVGSGEAKTGKPNVSLPRQRSEIQPARQPRRGPPCPEPKPPSTGLLHHRTTLQAAGCTATLTGSAMGRRD